MAPEGTSPSDTSTSRLHLLKVFTWPLCYHIFLGDKPHPYHGREAVPHSWGWVGSRQTTLWLCTLKCIQVPWTKSLCWLIFNHKFATPQIIWEVSLNANLSDWPVWACLTGLSWIEVEDLPWLWAAPFHGLVPQLWRSEESQPNMSRQNRCIFSLLLTVDMIWLTILVFCLRESLQ